MTLKRKERRIGWNCDALATLLLSARPAVGGAGCTHHSGVLTGPSYAYLDSV